MVKTQIRPYTLGSVRLLANKPRRGRERESYGATTATHLLNKEKYCLLMCSIRKLPWLKTVVRKLCLRLKTANAPAQKLRAVCTQQVSIRSCSDRMFACLNVALNKRFCKRYTTTIKPTQVICMVILLVIKQINRNLPVCSSSDSQPRATRAKLFKWPPLLSQPETAYIATTPKRACAQRAASQPYHSYTRVLMPVAWLFSPLYVALDKSVC